MKLISDWTYLQQEFDCSFPDRFLMALRAFDNRRSVCPFLVEAGGRRFGLFLNVEKGNVEAAQLPLDIAPVYYQPYFNFDTEVGPPMVHLTLEDAVEAIADGDMALTVDRALPLGIARRLRQRFDLTVEEGAEAGPVTVRRVPRDEVLGRHAASRPAAAAIARRLLEASRHRDALGNWLDQPSDDRCERLDAALAEAGAAGILASSGINMQELSGTPMRGRRMPLAVLWRPGEPVAVIESGRRAEGTSYGSLAEALDALLPGGTLLVEEDDLSCGLAEEAALQRCETAPGDVLLRRCRDRGTAADLAFYVIATRASRAAIEAALAAAGRAMQAGETIFETDAYAVYLATLRGFFAEHAPSFTVARTLTNFHATARTSFPANPAPYPLVPGKGALKIDAGCLVMGRDGMMLGCSDIARTLCLDEPGRALLDVFREGVQDVLVPACQTGTTGAAIHRLAVDHVDSAESRLAGNPLFRRISDAPEDYARDVGHLLGRNNLAHLRFTADETRMLESGMIACCEYQWPVGPYAIAFEDTCLVTDAGGLNLTVD